MPVWNIPLIVKIIRRRSSHDLSLSWLWGVWGCMLLMIPWAFLTKDTVLRAYSFVNFVLFSGVVAVVMKYRTFPPHAQD
jgi:FtsH-binding integral membrane protein